MKIVVLDGYTENPGDLSWAGLEALGEVTVYDRTAYQESPLIAERIGDAEIVVMNKTPISKETIDKCPNIKLIAVLATGYNVVDYNYAKEKGIPVCNVPTYGTASVTITTDGQSSIVFGVRRLLYEMLYNLCDNAIKYNRPGGSVRIHVENREQEAAISVLDTGIGIAPEHQSRIFERFYRVDKSHSKASGGTGLGLSIVKHAAMYHGGKVALESEPGRGTEIRVTLPKEH